MMENAKKAVACLTAKSLTTLKAFSTPPAACVTVANAVMLLRKWSGKKDWSGFKNDEIYT